MFVRISGRACTGLHRGRRDDPGPGRRGQDWSWNRNRPGSRVHQVQQGNGIVIASKALNAHLQSSAPVIIPKTGKIFGQIFQQTIFADVPDKLPVWDTDSLKCALTCWEIILIHVLLWKQRNTHNIYIYIYKSNLLHACYISPVHVDMKITCALHYFSCPGSLAHSRTVHSCIASGDARVSTPEDHQEAAK